MSQKFCQLIQRQEDIHFKGRVTLSGALSYFKTYTHIGVSSEHTTEALKATAMPHAILNPAMHLSQYIPWKAMVFWEMGGRKIIEIQYKTQENGIGCNKINNILSKWNPNFYWCSEHHEMVFFLFLFHLLRHTSKGEPDDIK